MCKCYIDSSTVQCANNQQCRKIERTLFRPLPVQCARIGAALDGGGAGQFSVMAEMPS